MKINFDKIKNINQLLLLLATTLLIVFIVFGGLLIAYDMIKYSFREDTTIGILSNEEANKLSQDSLRSQIISFDNINIVDSVKQLLLLPVSQADLVEYESNQEMLGIINSFSSNKYKYLDGIHNNLVLCNLNTRSSTIIFGERISISDFMLHESNGKKYIVVRASSNDTNNDKYLNSKDLQDLFIYDVDNDKLTKLKTKENFTTIQLYQPKKSNELIGQFGIDRDDNGEFKSYSEPMLFFKIDFVNMKMINLVEDEQIATLQNLLEGK